MKIYVAGPMTGYPQFNFPLFAKVTKILRDQGQEVISPAEQDPPEVQAAAIKSTDGHLHDGQIAGHTWGDCLARDVKIIADHEVDAICLLPGWEASRGACLEAFVGLLCGLEFFEYDDESSEPGDRIRDCSPAFIRDRIHRSPALAGRK